MAGKAWFCGLPQNAGHALRPASGFLRRTLCVLPVPVWVTVWVSGRNSLKTQINKNARKPHEYTVSGLFYWSEWCDLNTRPLGPEITLEKKQRDSQSNRCCIGRKIAVSLAEQSTPSTRWFPVMGQRMGQMRSRVRQSWVLVNKKCNNILKLNKIINLWKIFPF